jgi:hypothetical protein
LVRTYVIASAAEIPVTCWFSAQDSVDGPMGLSDNKGRRRLAYNALRELAIELGDYVYAGQPVGQRSPVSGPQVFEFHKPATGERKLVAWSIGKAGSLLIPADGMHAAAQYTLGETPIYLPDLSEQQIKQSSAR